MEGKRTLTRHGLLGTRGQGFNGDTFSDLPFSTTWEATGRQPDPGGILIVYTAGRHGPLWTGLSRPRRMRVAAAIKRRGA